MAKNKEPRIEKAEHLNAVRNVLIANNIDLTLVEAGRTLYKSLILAKERTKNREDYRKKGIKYKFPKSYKRALLEIIQGDKEFWEAWIMQQEIYDRTGLDNDRPTIHRLDSDGHYETGNIAVLSYGEHLKENAKSVIVVDTEAKRFTTYKTQTEFQMVERINSYKMGKINKSFQNDVIHLQRKQQIRQELIDGNKVFSQHRK